MKKCPKCGTLVENPDARFCEKCGVDLANPDLQTEKQKSKFPWLLTCLIVFGVCFIMIPIIAILAAIAIPNFLKFEAKSKQSEARTILTGIYEAEMAYFATENRFSSYPEEIGYEPPAIPKYYQFKIIYADEYDFVARAWGNIDGDSQIDIWEVTDDAREPVCIYDDYANFGEEIDPLETEESTLSEVEDPNLTDKLSECRAILTGIYEAELAYFAYENKFSSDLDEIGFEPHSPPKYYQFKVIHADKDGFVARAWGNIDRDIEIDIWEGTDDSREPVNIYSDIMNDGEEIDPLQLR